MCAPMSQFGGFHHPPAASRWSGMNHLQPPFFLALRMPALHLQPPAACTHLLTKLRCVFPPIHPSRPVPQPLGGDGALPVPLPPRSLQGVEPLLRAPVRPSQVRSASGAGALRFRRPPGEHGNATAFKCFLLSLRLSKYILYISCWSFSSCSSPLHFLLGVQQLQQRCPLFCGAGAPGMGSCAACWHARCSRRLPRFRRVCLRCDRLTLLNHLLTSLPPAPLFRSPRCHRWRWRSSFA